MDGAYETRKISTLKSRLEGVVRDNVKREQFPEKTYTPVFLKTVFLEVLAEQKIPCYQTMGEADCTIAYVAHLLGDCYILSSDSDFMVYINSKAILLKSLRFAKAAVGKSVLQKEENNALEVKADGSPTKVWTLQAQFVSIHRLCDEEFQMRDRRLLPLAAVILGNDYIHAKAFKSFQALKANGNSHTSSGRIESIMKWLGRKQSVQVGVDALTRLVDESKKKI
ncbi:unnamed protein product [Orchesella dallaii]|uniref:Asteroid domain-containing protein n=1 Tax=Orchesella dallaii TaxID=48710 RepID=A0ABP1Q0D5_9HEXA